MVSYIENAKENGATIELGGGFDEQENFIEPTLISNLKEDSLLLNEELFGPILPLKTFVNIEEAINYINSKEKPLALYMYSNNKKNVEKVIDNTRAGGTCVNTNSYNFV